MSVTVLHVAEKPSICTAVAKALSGGKMETRGRTPPVHEFHGSFKNHSNCLIRVTSVVGHVFSTDFPSQYNRWDATDPYDLFEAEVKQEAENKGIVKHLEREGSGVDYLVLWLDCDREGENICFEVMKCMQHKMKKFSGSKQQIFRAKFSAVTEKDIRTAMSNLGSPNKHESDAVEARQEMDLKVGVAFTRFQTKYFQGRYGDLDSSVISYGPCQTPTLGFVVDRYDEIQSFQAEPFWVLDISIDCGGGASLPVQWQKGRLFDESTAAVFLALVKNDGALKCVSVKKSDSRKTRPQPMNTVEMLKMASKQLGIGPQAAMRAAENLYLSGCLSYPRTESTQYPRSFDIREAISFQKMHHELGNYANELIAKGWTNPRNGIDMGDHPPITPVGPIGGGMTSDSTRLYDMVARHFLATVSPDAKFEVTKLQFVAPASGEFFKAAGKTEKDPGFLRIYRLYEEKEDYGSDALLYGERTGEEEEDFDVGEIAMPSQINQAGGTYSIATARLRQGKTSPPGYMTEADLISHMEKHGIGTDASIATHINNIIVRNYVNLSSGRTLVPTMLGVVLVHGYKRIDPDLVFPDVRAAIEKFCDMVAKAKASKEDVLDHSIRNFQEKYKYYVAHIEAMDQLFAASFSALKDTGKPLGKCGKCLRYMKLIESNPKRMYCPTCEETYNLPQGGTIKLYKGLKCPLDNYELVLYSLGNTKDAQGKSFPLCPYCYNHPPTFDIEEEGDIIEEEAEEGGNEKVGASLEYDESNEKEAAPSTETIKTKTNVIALASKKTVVKKHRMISHMGCNSCMSPSCKHSGHNNGMLECPNTTKDGDPCPGTLVLDITSKPNWKLACNETSCHVLLRFTNGENIANILPQAKTPCEHCGMSSVAQFDFKEGKSPFKDNRLTTIGCIMCDDTLNETTELITGRSKNLKVVLQERYKRGAGGRGRRGRGRGRGGGSYKSKHDRLMSFDSF
jgi:DNA topoisomerase III